MCVYFLRKYKKKIAYGIFSILALAFKGLGGGLLKFHILKSTTPRTWGSLEKA